MACASFSLFADYVSYYLDEIKNFFTYISIHIHIHILVNKLSDGKLCEKYSGL